jgi:IclR family acetate operon transcriptional repressor
MTQIAEQIGMNKSTVHRLLATLEGKRFVQRDPATGAYCLGIRLLQMAYLTLEQNDLRPLAAPFLRHLSDEYRETVHLAVLDDADVVFLDVIESPQRVKLAAAVGQRLPGFATAAGKSILAFMPIERVQHLLKRGIPHYTRSTLQSPEAFLENLEQVRHCGYALDEEELEEGINAVAAPILDLNERPLATVSIAGPAYRLTRERLVEIGPRLLSVAREIAREIQMAAHLDLPSAGNSQKAAEAGT